MKRERRLLIRYILRRLRSKLKKRRRNSGLARRFL